MKFKNLFSNRILDFIRIFYRNRAGVSFRAVRRGIQNNLIKIRMKNSNITVIEKVKCII